MSALPCIDKDLQVNGQPLKVFLPENAVQIFSCEQGKFIPLAEAFDVQGTLGAALEDDTFTPDLITTILSEWQDWYRVPTESALKMVFPDSGYRQPDGSVRSVRNVVQEHNDSPDYARFQVRLWVPGRENPVVMTLSFPAVYRGLVHKDSLGRRRLWRDIVMPDGNIVRSLGVLIIMDLLENKQFLLRRAKYVSDGEIQARWQSRINRITDSLYLGKTDGADSENLSDYLAEAVSGTIRLKDVNSTTSSPEIPSPAANLRHTATLVSALVSSGEIADPLHTSAGSPCKMFYRPWTKHPEDGEPIQLWKHPLSKMVNSARVGVLAGDIHCLPLAKGSHHRIQVEGFPYYSSVNTRDLLGVACDIPGVLGDGLIISEKAAEELAVVITESRMLSPDELINARGSAGESRLSSSKATPIMLPMAGGNVRKWRIHGKPRVRKLRVGDKLQSNTIKGVVNRILPVEEMPKVLMPDGSLKPADIIFSWRHWQKWVALSELCRAQLAFWCAGDTSPLTIEHGKIATLEQVQAMVESAGGSRDLTLTALIPEKVQIGAFQDTCSGETQIVYGGYFPVGVREELVDVQSQESSANPERLHSMGDMLDEVEMSLLLSDRVSTKGVRLGYADINCLVDEYPQTTRYLLGYSNDSKLTELAKLIASAG